MPRWRNFSIFLDEPGDLSRRATVTRAHKIWARVIPPSILSSDTIGSFVDGDVAAALSSALKVAGVPPTIINVAPRRVAEREALLLGGVAPKMID